MFWSCALGGYIIYVITVFNGDEIEGFCLLLLSAIIAAIVGAIYALVKFVNWSGEEPDAEARAVKGQPNAAIRRKDLAAVKKQADPQKAALLQYIHEAVRDGGEEGAVRSALLDKGWPEELVAGAFSAYKEILAKYPLPEKGLSA